MYRDHQSAISGFARAKPENLCAVIQFAAISARIKFYNVPAIMEQARAGEAGASAALFGWKRTAWDHAESRDSDIFWNCEDIAERSRNRRERGTLLVRYLADEVPGLGLAKAGFVAQMTYGCAGCLDSVNIERCGIRLNTGDRAHSMKKQATPQRRLALARWYVATCERLGGPGRLWDSWCAEMANRYPVAFATAEAASAWHLECLNI